MRRPFHRLASLAFFAAAPLAADESLRLTEPPAQPGECWVPVLVPATRERRQEPVEIKPAGERIERTPARYGWVEKTVTLPPRRVRVVVRPAEYETREEQVQVHPVDEVRRRIPAVTRTETRRVVAATGPVLKPNPKTGALCVVQAPIAWREERHTVVVKPARTEWVERPALSRTVRHRTRVKPAVTEWRELPARTVTNRERVLLEPPGERRVPVPAVMGEATREIQTAPARNDWRAVLCGVNAGTERVQAIQRALRDKGFEPGHTDGRYVEATAVAMRAFERDAGLPADGFSSAGLRQLGVSTR